MNKIIEKIENEEMIEELNRIAKGIKLEIRAKAERELDQYVKELLK